MLKSTFHLLLICFMMTTMNPNAMSKESSDIIVVGAGMSGVAAAHYLKEKGHDVLILEARDRVGGRIWTQRKWKDVPLEIGAGWVEGMNGNPLTDLARKLKLEIDDIGGDDMVIYNSDGKELTDEEYEYVEEGLEYFVEFIEEVREELDYDVSFQEAVDAFAEEEDLDQEERRVLNYLVNSIIETDYVGDSSELSLGYFDQDDGFDGESGVVLDGYDEMVKRLAKDIPIQLGQEVKKIDARGDFVAITTTDREFKAKKVLVTVPLGVLKKGKIKFSPPLPSAKKGALSRLKTGVLHRTYFLFDEVFWDKKIDSIGHIGKTKGEWPVFLNLYPHTNLPLLLAFNGGHYGSSLDRMTDAQILKDGMSVLRKIYGSSIPDPVDGMASHWGTDPYSYGAYSFVPLGATGEEFDILAEPIADKIFFAGEATMRRYPGTVHGAYLSGIREAKRLHSN